MRPGPEQRAITRIEIVEGLRQVGIGSGDIALVHSSLSSFGYIEGGADTVIDALLQAVGPEGTIVMPAFTWGPHDKPGGVYDVDSTPVDRIIGIIPETFRCREGVIRSLHVCHSICMFGPHAEMLMGDGKTAFGPGSSFEILYELDSWNLFLGVGSCVCTALHIAEERSNVPYRFYREFSGFAMILPNGKKIQCRSMENLRKDGYENDFTKMDEVFADENITSNVQIGCAKINLMRIRDVVDVAAKYLRKDIGYLLDEKSRDRLRQVSDS